jgi:hypothetical protein
VFSEKATSRHGAEPSTSHHFERPLFAVGNFSAALSSDNSHETIMHDRLATFGRYCLFL